MRQMDAVCFRYKAKHRTVRIKCPQPFCLDNFEQRFIFTIEKLQTKLPVGSLKDNFDGT